MRVEGRRGPSWYRRAAGVLAVAALGLATSACGDDSAGDGAEQTATEPPANSEGETAVEPAPESPPESASAEEPVTSEGTASPQAGDATRPVETERGIVDVPVAPERIVALDEYAAMDLLALGVKPAVVLGTYQSEVGRQILTDAGVEFVPSSFTLTFDVEQVASFRPDLIVFTSEANDEDNTKALEQVAPTVVIPYERPWREILQFTAELVDRPDEAAAVEAMMEERIAEVTGTLGDVGTISMLANTPGFGFFTPSESAPISQLVEEVGLGRPAAQQGPGDMGSAIMTSEENLGDHDADLVVVFDGNYYDASAVESLATYRALSAVADGRAYAVDGDMWLGTFPFAVLWVLDDLEALLSGQGADGIGAVDDAAERWAASGLAAT